MIRINLLPVRQAKKREYGKQQLLVGLLVLIAEGVALYLWASAKTDKVDQLDGQLRSLQAEVDELDRENRVINELNDRKDQLQNLQRILEELEANRAGPVQVLDELKVMLNPPANDLERVSQQRRGWDTNWDPTRLWLGEFNEEGGRVELAGHALSNDDIAEFNTRLASSIYFSTVRLKFTRAAGIQPYGRVYSFAITASVNYGILEEQG